MRRLVLSLALLPALWSAPALAQDKAQTLADLKAELAQLSADFNTLKAELVQGGAASTGAAGGDALQRLDTIEAELTRVTAKTEEIELKLNKVVTDGTNRIGDIEYRLCEQTKGCDPDALPETAVLGGDTAAADTTAPAAETTAADTTAADTTAAAPADTTSADQPDMAIGEKNDFDRAKGVLGQGDFQAAADKFAAFAQSYPGSPLMQEAQFQRGEALSKLGNTAEASRAYLEAFSGKPEGSFAAESLLKLGQGLGTLGQTQDACVTLAEVGKRYPGTIHATNAQVSMQGLACP